MTSLKVTGALREAGLSFGVEGGRLWVEPASRMTPDLVVLVRQHKEDLASLARTRDATGPPVENTREVFELARSILNPEGIDYGPAPVSPAPPGRDPMAKPYSNQAEFYREVKRKDKEKREREGLPPWIRIIEGGAS